MGGSQSTADDRYRLEHCGVYAETASHREELERNMKDHLENMERNGIMREITDFPELDVLFYYFLKDERDLEIERVIRQNNRQFWVSDTWFEVCTQILYEKTSFVQFLSGPCQNNPAILEYIFNKQPQLLFNIWSNKLLEAMIEHLPFDNLHQILMNARDKHHRTVMFYDFFTHVFVELYRNHIDELCELLSISDFAGQTALHVNAKNLTILLNLMTLNNQDELCKLLKIKDDNGKFVFDVVKERERKKIAWVTKQVENEQYPLHYSLDVCVLYNTQHRPGAMEEALSINDTLTIIARGATIRFEEMGRKDEIIERIEEMANRARSGLIVILMSHGNVGTIDDSDGKPFALKHIEMAMCTEQLKKKPKVLITQCCQVSEEECETEQLNSFPTSSSFDGAPPKSSRDVGPYVPAAADFCAIQSSVTGQPSERNVFLPYLAKHLIRSEKKDDLENLIKRVSKQMSKERRTQTPIVQSTLRGKLCLRDMWR